MRSLSILFALVCAFCLAVASPPFLSGVAVAPAVPAVPAAPLLRGETADDLETAEHKHKKYLKKQLKAYKKAKHHF